MLEKIVKRSINMEVHTAYVMSASIIGIFCNILLFGIKLTVGLILKSVSVTADAFNNLSDAVSSVIGFVGAKMAGKPADKDHPFGHGRIEYITALVVSFLVIQVGFSFLKSSFEKIRSPQVIQFQTLSVMILVISIGIKLWLFYVNRKLGRKINSIVLIATAADAMGDVAATSATVISVLISHFLGLNIDGIIGLVVSCLIIWAGIGIAKDTLKPLIGEPVDPKMYQELSDFVCSYDGIVGSHDLIVHNYGPSRSMASIHAEVPNDVDIEVSHEIIDRIEREAAHKFGIFLVIHMDPIETKDDKVLKTKQQLESIVTALDDQMTIHDFRLVPGDQQKNLVFDLVVPYSFDDKKIKQVKAEINEKLGIVNKGYKCIITVDKSFIAEES